MSDHTALWLLFALLSVLFVLVVVTARRGPWRPMKPCVPISCPPIIEQEITLNLCTPIDCAACGQPGDANECYLLTHHSAPYQPFYVHPDCAKSPAGKAALAELSYRLGSPGGAHPLWGANSPESWS